MALLKIEDYEMDLECTYNDYTNLGKFLKTLREFRTYIENNQALIPNYGERWRYVGLNKQFQKWYPKFRSSGGEELKMAA